MRPKLPPTRIPPPIRKKSKAHPSLQRCPRRWLNKKESRPASQELLPSSRPSVVSEQIPRDSNRTVECVHLAPRMDQLRLQAREKGARSDIMPRIFSKHLCKTSISSNDAVNQIYRYLAVVNGHLQN